MSPESLTDRQFRRVCDSYRVLIEKRLRALTDHREPGWVYEPVRYALSGGGKRIRSLLVLFSCEAAGGDPLRALNAAAAMEILHNFTLVHDDVMDNAELRRGKPTVHRRWSANAAILSGDELVALAYRAMLRSDSNRLPDILRVFTESFVEVCEGQALDKEFERRSAVSLAEYLRMIGKKTGRIIGASAEIGAIIGGARPAEAAALRSFGEHLGRAFQIRDDLLDVAGTVEEFGKEIGSDIREKKKTYLFVAALGRARGNDRAFLASIPRRKRITKGVIDRVRRIYGETGALERAARAVERSTASAQKSLGGVRRGKGKDLLLGLSRLLLDRAA